MTGSITISIPSLSAIGIGGSKRAESLVIAEIIDRGMQVMISSLAASVTLKDLNGTTAGTISWTPVNAT